MADTTTTRIKKAEKIHFRVLVLDQDETERSRLEKSFLATYEMDGKSCNFEDTKFYFVSDLAQMDELPSISAYNMAWISVGFPDCYEIARRFYFDNPFCYQVFYGNSESVNRKMLRSRPVGFVTGADRIKEIHYEMDYVWACFKMEKEMLRLWSRSSEFWVSYGNILYLQSRGRKSYIYINSVSVFDSVTEEDIFVKKAENPNELFAYTQNRKLEELYEKLDRNRFIRIHKSYIVNSDYVRGLSRSKYGWMVILEDKGGRITQLPVSEPYHAEVEQLVAERRISSK